MLYSCRSYNYLNEDIKFRYDYHTKLSQHRLKMIFLAEADIENCTVESKIKSPQNAQKSSVISCSAPSVNNDRKPDVLEDIKKEQETTNPSYDLVVPTCLSSCIKREAAGSPSNFSRKCRFFSLTKRIAAFWEQDWCKLFIAKFLGLHVSFQNEFISYYFWHLTNRLSYPAVGVVLTIAETSAQCAGTTRWPTHRAGSGADSSPGSWCRFRDGAPLSRSRKRAIPWFIGARGLGSCTKEGISWWNLTRSW